MSIPSKLINFLNKKGIKYDILKHKTVYTAYDLATTLKKRLSDVTKTIIVKMDKKYALVVLPASRYLDLEKLQKILNAKKIELITEKVMTKIFKIKPGAISPFGELHNKMDVHIDKALLKTQKLITQAGSFENSLHIKMKDFLKATSGIVGNFSLSKKPIKKQKK